MNEARIAEIERQLAELPAGYLVYKNIKGKAQPYLQRMENGRTVSKYIKIAEREEILRKMVLKKTLQEELKKLRTVNASTAFAAGSTEVEEDPFRTHVIRGDELLKMTSSVREYQKRDCFSRLHTPERSVCCMDFGVPERQRCCFRCSMTCLRKKDQKRSI